MGGRSKGVGGARGGGREMDDGVVGDGRDEERPRQPAEGVGRVPLHRLFSFADRADAALMAVGTIAAVANGMAQPLMTFIFGDVIDAFGSAESSDHVLHRVVKVLLLATSFHYFLYFPPSST
ncbi:unnamed protein product [Urochloa humidicola]